MALLTNARLHETIKAVVPSLQGVSIGTFGVASSILVSPASLQAAAQSTIDAFDWSDAAQAAWENTQARTAAQTLLADPTSSPKLLRAVLLVLLDEINTLRGAVIPALPARTVAQARTAIGNKITSGAADT